MTVKELIHDLALLDGECEVALDADWDDTAHPVIEVYEDITTNKVILTA